MCGSMVGQCPTADIRRGNKKEERRNHRMKIYMAPALLHRAAIDKLSNCPTLTQHRYSNFDAIGMTYSLDFV